MEFVDQDYFIDGGDGGVGTAIFREPHTLRPYRGTVEIHRQFWAETAIVFRILTGKEAGKFLLAKPRSSAQVVQSLEKYGYVSVVIWLANSPSEFVQPPTTIPLGMTVIFASQDSA